MMVGTGCTVHRYNMLRPDGTVQPAYALLKTRMPFHMAISQPFGTKLLKKRVLIFPCECKQFIDRHRIDTGFCNVVHGTCLPLIHPFFHSKRLNMHKFLLLIPEKASSAVFSIWLLSF